MSTKEHPPQHVPVLLDKVLELLNPKSGENYLDLTAGYGGHATEILRRTENYQASVLVDRDINAINALKPFEEKGVRLIHDDFLATVKELIKEGRKYSLLLVDLGVSSPQLDRATRGFSFRNDGPLDMRMDSRQELTAAKVINSYTEEDLTNIIVKYGEEPYNYAKRIAGTIIAGRPIESTGQLSELIERSHRGRRKKIHPATRTFQAVRIHVNDELSQVEQLMPLLPELLATGGRAGIISFHSLEDRIVKRYFADQAASGYEAELNILTKKPIDGSTYDVHNPRSRSAKLRVAVKK
ncbi:MAG: 16S rRNA (cytosine(1402)-N(4))-methyltransferase RsmH [Candidatus Saccharimonadaceae bacterium]